MNLWKPGKNYTFPDPETSSDSEEDALRRLNSRNHLPPDTLTIQAEDELPSIQGWSKKIFH